MLSIVLLLANKTEIVFDSGGAMAGFDTFRIPTICRTSDGTLIAFAEGRESVADQAGNAIVCRRKMPGAKEWGPVQAVQSGAPHALNNPCALATKSGRVWLMYQRYPAGHRESNVKAGFSPADACLSYVVYSDDHGKTWSKPRDISRSVKREGARSVASGPGIGIELASGRLVFPFNQGIAGDWNVYAVYSDDKGTTWQMGEIAPKSPGLQPNEVQIAELHDGRLLLNARNQAAGKFRVQSWSEDGGRTWSRVEAFESLTDPVCMGSLLSVDGVLAFSNPVSVQTRVNGGIRLSRNGGQTWTSPIFVEKGSFAYSCLVRLGEKEVGVLYEHVTFPEGKERYTIQFVRVSLP